LRCYASLFFLFKTNKTKRSCQKHGDQDFKKIKIAESTTNTEHWHAAKVIRQKQNSLNRRNTAIRILKNQDRRINHEHILWFTANMINQELILWCIAQKITSDLNRCVFAPQKNYNTVLWIGKIMCAEEFIIILVNEY